MKRTNTMPYKIGSTNAATPATTEASADHVVNLDHTPRLWAPTGTGIGVDQPYTMALRQAGICLTAFCTNTAATNKVHAVYVVH